jgi:hypothetical protein
MAITFVSGTAYTVDDIITCPFDRDSFPVKGGKRNITRVVPVRRIFLHGQMTDMGVIVARDWRIVRDVQVCHGSTAMKAHRCCLVRASVRRGYAKETHSISHCTS